MLHMECSSLQDPGAEVAIGIYLFSTLSSIGHSNCISFASALVLDDGLFCGNPCDTLGNPGNNAPSVKHLSMFNMLVNWPTIENRFWCFYLLM